MSTNVQHLENTPTLILDQIESRSTPSKPSPNLFALLLEYLQPSQNPPKNIRKQWELILGSSYNTALHALIHGGYLKPYASKSLNPITFLSRFKGGGATQRQFVVTEKARNSVNFCAILDHPKNQDIAQFLVDRCFAARNLQEAVQVISYYGANRPDIQPNLWNGSAEPSEMTLLTTEIILKSPLRFLSRLSITPEQEQLLRFQAAEIALTNVLIFDRLKSVSPPLHPRGNLWLLRKVLAYGRQKAASQAIKSDKLSQSQLEIRHDTQIVKAAVSDQPGENSLTINQLLLEDRNNEFANLLPNVRFPVRIKITLPYVFLVLVFAIIGAYLISQIVLETLEERFANQLVEVGKLSVDRMVLEENQRLEALRLMANIQGVSDAVVARNTEQLRALVLPIAVNAHEEIIHVSSNRTLNK